MKAISMSQYQYKSLTCKLQVGDFFCCKYKYSRMIYTTNRLIIRKWKEADAQDLYEYCSDSEVTKYLTFLTYTTMAEAVTRIKAMHQLYCTGTKDAQIDFAIELKATGKVIGSIGFMGYNNKSETIELGYVLNPKFQGQGYMTESLKGMIAYIKDNEIALYIEAKCDTANKQSGKVMERAGMTYQGIRKGAGNYNSGNGVDVMVWSIKALQNN